jgi:serine/threonine protein kinase
MLEAGLGGAPEAPAFETLPGSQKFGDYEVIEEIARGGMGVVYRAWQISLNRVVALKMILAGRLASEIELQRFHEEARAAAALHHPNIVAIHEVGEFDGQPFFSMDLVEGMNLADAVRAGPFSPSRAAACVRAVAEAIQYAHERGILHRDLKPSNVLLDAAGNPHVTDFGLAKKLNSDPQLTLSGQVLGSPNFMPPEQAAGKHRELTPASDVYSLGALLYHLLTGRPPFLADNVPATLRLVSESEPMAPRRLVPTIPRDLETICLKCLEKEQPRRYGNARELGEELDRFLNDEPIHARPLSPTEKFARLCRRHPTITALSALVALLLIALAGVSFAFVSKARSKPYVLPLMIDPPHSQTVRSGSTASFKANVRGTPPLEYQWSFHDVPIFGATNAVLILTNVQQADAGEYTLAVTNTGYGHSLSAAARLFIHPHPELVPDPTGLLAWWSGEDDAVDLSGDGHHGVISTSVSFVSSPFGKAFQFDGAAGHVSITNSASLVLTGAMSIIAWVKPDQITNAPILSKYDVGRWGRPHGVSFMFVFDANHLRFEVAGSPGLVSDPPFRLVETDATLVLRSVFSQVAATFDPATQAMRIFVNGNEMPVSLVAGSTDVSAIYHTQVPVRLGALVGPSDVWSMFPGSIDEVGLFARALKPDEIKASYAAGRSHSPPESRP